jgi:hypothetical protein
MKKLKFLLVFLFAILAGCQNTPNQITAKENLVVVDDAGYPTGELELVTNQLPSEVPSGPDFDVLFGTEPNKIITECALGRISEGKVYLPIYAEDCVIISVPEEELNSNFGLNITMSRPALELDLVAGKKTIFVDGRFSPVMQALLVAEYMYPEEFYTNLPGYVNTLIGKAPYWEGVALNEQIFLNGREGLAGKHLNQPSQLVTLGGTYGSIFGEKPKIEAEALHRGRFIEILLVHNACFNLKQCSYEENFSSFKPY